MPSEWSFPFVRWSHSILNFTKSRNNILGIKTFLAFTIGTFAIGSVVTFKYKFLPSFDVLWGTGTELYIAPWTRVSPYCVGVACGWYLHSYRKTFNVSDVSRATLTLLTLHLLIAFLLSSFSDSHRDCETFCFSFQRSCWCLHFTVQFTETWESQLLHVAYFLDDRWLQSRSAGSSSQTLVDITVS